MACTGQTWQEIGRDWDIPRLDAWNRYSRDHPPLHLLVAAYLGVKPKKSRGIDRSKDLMGFIQAMGAVKR
jgi:hypothetical protein